ncbi:unnamed protein product [Rhizophagus irregularis]|uniref:Uncharacterized protein n=1 Tax=Rhizophagus irregularis TaxID=588596 RepID=A0A915Z9Y6_9GLOM|nr:unnamed protein product [Rhizophagus irregularis]CAB5368659.1 unnamed protein product [Rhizophagus irregularis]
MSKNSQSSPPVAGELVDAEQIKKFLSFLTKEEMAVYETLTDEQKTFYLNVLKRRKLRVKKNIEKQEKICSFVFSVDSIIYRKD